MAISNHKHNLQLRWILGITMFGGEFDKAWLKDVWLNKTESQK